MDKPNIEMMAVGSSQIKEVGHDNQNNVLYIRFKYNNSLYSYQNVTEEQYLDMIMGELSVSKYFNAHIKKNPKKYPFKNETL